MCLSLGMDAPEETIIGWPSSVPSARLTFRWGAPTETQCATHFTPHSPHPTSRRAISLALLLLELTAAIPSRPVSPHLPERSAKPYLTSLKGLSPLAGTDAPTTLRGWPFAVPPQDT